MGALFLRTYQELRIQPLNQQRGPGCRLDGEAPTLGGFLASINQFMTAPLDGSQGVTVRRPRGLDYRESQPSGFGSAMWATAPLAENVSLPGRPSEGADSPEAEAWRILLASEEAWDSEREGEEGHIAAICPAKCTPTPATSKPVAKPAKTSKPPLKGGAHAAAPHTDGGGGQPIPWEPPKPERTAPQTSPGPAEASWLNAVAPGPSPSPQAPPRVGTRAPLQLGPAVSVSCANLLCLLGGSQVRLPGPA
uniref:Uncharacterized protein n=1 Tax=Sphaerodactylus townsendi TaxID=933632 RepID=A0ACB8F2I1_9SAUR